MKVLFSTYSLAFQNPGGGEEVLNSLLQALKSRDVSVDFFRPWEGIQGSYDIVHYFSCLETTFWQYIKQVIPHAPLVVTPTVWLPGRNRGWFGKFRQQLKWCVKDPTTVRTRLPDLWLPTTREESEILASYWNIPVSKMKVLRNGIHPVFTSTSDAEFKEKISISSRTKMVLHVGRFHPVKNQKAIIESGRQIAAHFIFIGDADLEHLKYYEECRHLANSILKESPESATKYTFLGALPNHSTLLASAYASADVLVLPSQFETYSQVAMEAMASGVPMVLTENMRAKERFDEQVDWVNPSDLGELIAAINRSLKKNRKQKTEVVTWDTIAGNLITIYAELLKEKQ